MKWEALGSSLTWRNALLFRTAVDTQSVRIPGISVTSQLTLSRLAKDYPGEKNLNRRLYIALTAVALLEIGTDSARRT